jgi:hypothetical protein
MRSPILAAALLLAALNCAASPRLEVTTAPLISVMSVARGGALVLHLDDVRVAGGESAMLRLFLNTPHATAKTSTSDARFLQDLYLVPSRAAKGRWSKGQNFTIPLPPDAARGERITVTIIPIEAGAGGEMNASGSVHVKLNRPYVTASR